VLPEYRNMDIGKTLLEKVADVSDLCGFGSPAPTQVKSILKSLGYSYERPLIKLKIPLYPTTSLKHEDDALRFQLKRMRDLLCRRLVFGGGADSCLVLEKPDTSLWRAKASDHVGNRSHFERTERRLQWMKEIPSNRDEGWWFYDSPNGFASGILRGHQSKKSVIVLDAFPTKSSLFELLGTLSCNFSGEGVSTIQCLVEEGEPRLSILPRAWKGQINVMSTTEYIPEYLSLLDIESSWVALEPPR